MLDRSGDEAELSFVIGATSANYRASSFSGQCELLWRTVLTACAAPSTSPAEMMGLQVAPVLQGLEWLTRPRRPAAVILTSRPIARALAPALLSIGVEARACDAALAKVALAPGLAVLDTKVRVPPGEWALVEGAANDSDDEEEGGGQAASRQAAVARQADID